MSVAILKGPDEISFSGDFINAEFIAQGHLETQGTPSENEIFFGTYSEPGSRFVLAYGEHDLYLEASALPILNGIEFPAGTQTNPITAEILLPYIQANAQLSQDFIIEARSDYYIHFTARKPGPGYDMRSFNTVPGTADVMRPNYSVHVRLMCQNALNDGFSEIYRANLNLQHGTAKTIANLGDKLHQTIAADINKYGAEIPSANAIQCRISCRKYYFKYGETYGQAPQTQSLESSPIYTTLHGALSFQAKGRRSALSIIAPGELSADRFLKQGPKQQKIRLDQPQFLYFFNTREERTVSVIVYKDLNDLTNAQQIPYIVILKANEKYGFDVSPARLNLTGVKSYHVYLADEAGNQVSEKLFYTIDQEQLDYPRYFLNWSSLGAMDCRLFTGRGTSSLEVTSQKATRILAKGYQVRQGQNFVFGSKVTQNFKATTGFKTAAEIQANTDFFGSDLKYRSINGQLLPIALTNNKIDLFQDGNNLHAQDFEYQYLFSDDSYSESDVFDKDPSRYTTATLEAMFGIIDAGTPAAPSLNIINQTI